MAIEDRVQATVKNVEGKLKEAVGDLTSKNRGGRKSPTGRSICGARQGRYQKRN